VITMSSEHDLEWNALLQEWLDGDLDLREQAQVTTHLQTCEACQQSVSELRALDDQLTEVTPSMALDDSFDARLFAQIDAQSEAQKLEARRRVQSQIQEELQALSRNWRRTLGTMLPGVLAGIAIALCASMYFDTAQWVRSFAAEGANEIAGVDASFIHLLLTSTIGAAIGYFIARWLTVTAE
jgi:anti-sigma factor RsiW